MGYDGIRWNSLMAQDTPIGSEAKNTRQAQLTEAAVVERSTLDSTIRRQPKRTKTGGTCKVRSA